MAVTLRQVETVTAYPDAPEGLSTAAAALEADALWARIEAYTAYRFTERAVVWTVDGEGDWTPPLTPASIDGAEKWEGTEWVSTTLPEGPFGYCLPGDGPYRITGTAGAGPVPAPVAEAFRRLAEYLSDTDDRPGASNYSVNMGGAIQESYDRAPHWVARAMINSGAADLLRPYRRA